jgi:hypothetical protein
MKRPVILRGDSADSGQAIPWHPRKIMMLNMKPKVTFEYVSDAAVVVRLFVSKHVKVFLYDACPKRMQSERKRS